MFAIKKGSRRKPTARSDTARFSSKMFVAKCKEDVFQIAIKMAEFPNSAVRKRMIRITAFTIRKFCFSGSCSEYPLNPRELVDNEENPTPIAINVFCLKAITGLVLDIDPLRRKNNFQHGSFSISIHSSAARKVILIVKEVFKEKSS